MNNFNIVVPFLSRENDDFIQNSRAYLLFKSQQKSAWALHKKTAQKRKFFIKDFISKCDQIRRKLGICLHLLKKPLMESCFFLCSEPSTAHEKRCWMTFIGLLRFYSEAYLEHSWTFTMEFFWENI